LHLSLFEQPGGNEHFNGLPERSTENDAMGLTCDQLVARHAKAWEEATRHPFLEGCRTGTIAHIQFATWLVQDHLCVVEFTRFAARVLTAAPVAHFDVLLNGLTALRDELSWFRTHAIARSLRLDVPRQAPCVQYCQFMERLAQAPYPVQATAFWAIEAVYNHAWRNASPMVAPYDEFARRWGSAEFGAYVEQLRHQADEALGTATGAEQVQAEAAFLEVLALEALFWQMAFSRERP
jgi:thiaminase